MLSYETLDAIADSVNPVIFLVTLAMPWLPLSRKALHPVRWVVVTALALGIVYGLSYLDTRLEIWPMWGLDYSTHSAFAAALLSLWAFRSKQGFVAGILIFVGYASLMAYQQYHTWRDIFSTVAVVIPMTIAMVLAIRPRLPAQPY